jgi:hypothetical protein
LKMKIFGVICSGLSMHFLGAQAGSCEEVGSNESLKVAGEGIHVGHLSCRVMDDGEMITKKFLCPASNDVDVTMVVEDFLNRLTVAQPIEHSTPEVFAVLGDCPAVDSSFTNKQMQMALGFGAVAGAETDGAEVGVTFGSVKLADACVAEDVSGGDRCGGVIRLH